jgi:hypothetical protein
MRSGRRLKRIQGKSAIDPTTASRKFDGAESGDSVTTPRRMYRAKC